MGFDAYEQLAVDPGAVGDVARSILETPPQPGESYADTQYRSAQQAGATARIQAIKGKQWAARGVPSYQDMQGNTKPVVDDTGSPLNKLDPKHNIAYDSTGSPKKIDFDVAGGSPVLKDPFEGLETTTDPKTGHQYQIAPGLPWRWVGTDAQTAQKAEFARQDADLSKASAALGRKLTLTEYDEKFHSDAINDVRSQLKQLSVADTDPVTGDPLDYDGLVAGINSQFDDLKKNDTTANAKEYFGMGGYKPEALKAQADLDLQRTAALRAAAKGHAHAQALGGIQQQAEAVRAQRMMIEQTKLDHETALLKAQGIDISQPMPPQAGQSVPQGMIQQGNIDLNTRPVVQNQDGTVSTVRSIGINVNGREVLIPTVSEDGRVMSNAEAVDTFKKTGRHLGVFGSEQDATRYAKQLHEQQAGQLDQSGAVQPEPDDNTTLDGKPLPPAALALRDAQAGKKPYKIDKKFQPQFSAEHPYDELMAMKADGLVDAEFEKKYADKFKKAQEHYAQLVKDAGGASQAKAILHGIGPAAAFMAGYGPGAAAGAVAGGSIGAAIGGGASVPTAGAAAPVTVPAGAAIGAGIGSVLGGLSAGSLAAWATHKAMNAAGEYSDVMKSLNASAELHPILDEVGGFLAFSTGAPKAIANLAKVGKIANTSRAAAIAAGVPLEEAGMTGAKVIAGQLARGAVGGLAFEGLVRPGFDATVNMVADGLGIDHEQLQTPTVKSLAVNAALGVLLAGKHIKFKDYNAQEVASVAFRGQMRKAMGVDYAAPVDPATVSQFAEKAGMTSDQVAQMSQPMNPQEAALYEQIGKQVDAMKKAGSFDNLKLSKLEAQQAFIPGLTPGKGTAITSATIGGERAEPGAPESRAGLGAPEAPTPAAPAGDRNITPQQTKPKPAEPGTTNIGEKLGSELDKVEVAPEPPAPTELAPASVAKASPEIPIDIDQRIAPVIEDFTQRLDDADRKIAMAKGQGNSDMIAEAKAQQDAIYEEMKQRLGTDFFEQVPQIVRDRLEGGAHEWEDGKGLREKSAPASSSPAAPQNPASSDEWKAAWGKQREIFTDENGRQRARNTVASPRTQDLKPGDRVVAFADGKAGAVSGGHRDGVTVKFDDGTSSAFNNMGGLVREADLANHLPGRAKSQNQPPAPNEPKLPASERNDQSQPEGAKPAGGASEVAKTEEGKPGGEPAGQAGGKPDAEAVERHRALATEVQRQLREVHGDTLVAATGSRRARIVGKGEAGGAGLMAVREGGKIEILVSPEDLLKSLADVEEKNRAAFLEKAIQEEVMHTQTLAAANERDASGNLTERAKRFSKGLEQLPTTEKGIVEGNKEKGIVGLREQRKKTWDKMSEIDKGHEILRVIMQGRDNPGTQPTTESTWDTIKAFVEWLKSHVKNLSASSKKLLSDLESWMAKRKQDVAEAPSEKSKHTLGTGKPNGVKAEGHYDIVEAADLGKLVQTEIGDAQNRDRKNNQASKEQIEKIRQKPDASMLGKSPVSLTGAPTIDGEAVLAGNGRAIGLIQAWQTNPEGIAEYRDKLNALADELGLGDRLAGKQQPVLVFRATKFENGDRKDFVNESNPRNVGLGENTVEAALRDYDVLANHPDQIEFLENGNLSQESLRMIGATLDNEQRGVKRDPKGNYDLAEGTKRVQAAMLAGMAKKAGIDYSTLSDIMQSDFGKRALGSVLSRSGKLATLDADLSLANPIMEALRDFQTGLAAVKSSQYESLPEWYANRKQELIREPISEEGEELLSLFARSNKSAKELNTFLDDYITAATAEQKERAAEAGMGSMFGDERAKTSPLDIIKRIGAAKAPEADTDLFDEAGGGKAGNPNVAAKAAEVKPEAKPAKPAKKDEAEVSDEEYFGNILRMAADKPNELRVPDVDRVMSAVKPEEVEKFRAWLLDQGPFKQPGVATEITTWTAEEPAAPKEYAYGMQNRPRQIGAQPKDFSRVDENDKRGRHGVIFYNRKLTADEIYSFELKELGESPEPAAPKEDIVLQFENGAKVRVKGDDSHEFDGVVTAPGPFKRGEPQKFFVKSYMGEFVYRADQLKAQEPAAPEAKPPAAEAEARAQVLKDRLNKNFKKLKGLEAAKPAGIQYSNARITPPGIVMLEAAVPIRAHHGTPHEVDQFKLEKIGTGEGAQVYGWGLYFAENPAVADDYSKKLSARGSYDGQPFDNRDPRHHAADILRGIVGDDKRTRAIQHAERAAEAYNGKGESAELLQKAADILREKKEAAWSKDGGNTYTVQLDVEADDLLDWDKPLSEQSGKVRDILHKSWLAHKDDHAHQTGAEIYSIAADNYQVEREGGGTYGDRRRGAEAIAKQLASLGIPGIRYLDQGSRQRIEVFRETGGDRWYVDYSKGVSPIERKWFSGGAAESAARLFAERLKESQTYNYVIFDESKIKITHKNGEDATKQEMSRLEAEAPRPVSKRLQALQKKASEERALTLDEQAERDTLERAEGQGFMDFAAPITPGEVAAKKEADIKAKAKAAIEFRLNRKLVGGNIETQTDAFGPQADEGGNLSLFAEKPEKQTEPAPAFYSQLTKTVQAIPQLQMTVQQARAAIEKGAKKDEIAMSGIFTDPLSPLAGKQPGDKVTKAELTGYALERQAVVSDVVLGQPLGDKVKKSAQDAVPFSRQGFDGWIIPDANGDMTFAGSTKQDAADRWNDAWRPTDTPTPTHFSQYQLPGADVGSYREMFVTWPGDIAAKEKLPTGWKIESQMDGQVWNVYDADGKYRTTGRTKNEAERQAAAVARAGDWQKTLGWRDGHSQYSDIANPIVRIRRNIRTDAEGRKTYFIEEMQGPGKGEQEKMPPELRKRIYEIGMKRALRDAVDEGADAIAWTTGTQQLDRYTDALRQQVDRISWVEMPKEEAFKPLSKLPDGYELIHDSTADPQRQWAIIPPGQQHARSFAGDHPTQEAAKKAALEQVNWLREGDYNRSTKFQGAKLVRAEKGGEIKFSGHVGEDGKFIDGPAAGKDVDEVLDKETAAKIKGDIAGDLKGDNLTIGGKGLKSVYDQMLPAIANDLAKKFGVKAGRAELPSSEDGHYLVEHPDFHTRREHSRAKATAFVEANPGWTMRPDPEHRKETPATTVHSLPIPEALKTQQRTQGSALFAEAPTAGATDRQKKMAAAAWKAKGVESSYFKKWQGKAELYRIGDDLISAENGKPVLVEGFHGTTHDFAVVDPSKANVENDMGQGFYVTNTPEDVQENYAGEGPDLTNRIERKAEQLDSEVDGMEPEEMVEQLGISEYDASVLVDTEPYSYGSPQAESRTKILKKIARKELTQHGGATMKVFVKLENPLKLGENEPYWDSESPADENGDPVGEPIGKMIDFLQAIRNESRRDVDLSALEDAAMDGMKAGKAIAEAKKALGDSEDDNGNLNGNEIIRTAIERMGYDGILDGTVDEKFGYKKGLGKPMKGVGPSTVHVIAFWPEQVKSATGNRGTFTKGSRSMLEAEAPEKQKQLEFAGEIFTDAVQLGAHYIQTGSHRFTEWAEKMREDCGPQIEKYLKSIYETAKVTIESPRGESVEGRPPGLERGLRPPTERIVTARAEHTQHADESVIPDELKPHLDEHQRQGAAAGIASMEKIGGFLNADGTGAGKTRQALTVASHFAKQGKRVVIVTKAETIKQDWAKNTFGGSYGFDSKAMGIPLDLVRDGNVKPGKIGITTYQNLSDVDRNSGPDTVLIFDEAHALKNDSQQAKYGMSATQKANKVMFMSATPADKAEHIYYLAGIGIMEGKTVQKALEDLGMKLITVKKRDKSGRPYEVKFWAPDGKVSDTERNRRFSALFNRMTAKGAMIKREISMEGVHVNMLRVSLPPEGHDVQQDILRHFDATHIDDLQGLKRAIVLGHMRRQQEPFKIASTVMLAQRELDQGRQVVIFVSRVNASEVGKWVKGLDGERYRDILMSSEGTAKSLAEAMRDAGIHDIAEIHGNADQNSLEAMADFQSGKKRVVIATIESGGTGINLDDIVGNRPRSMIIVTAPFDAVGNVQAAGRIWRLKTLSGANLFYLFGNTDVDEWNKGIIGSKMAMLGAVVEGQVRKLDVSDPEQVSLDDFHSSVAPVSNEGSPRGEMPEGNAFPTLDWKPFKTKAGKDKFVAEATPEFWKWWKANGERNNPEGVSLSKWDGKWQVWSDREVGSTELSAAAPERITPEQDREYLAAVKGGDTEAAQRMGDKAAIAAGAHTNADGSVQHFIRGGNERGKTVFPGASFWTLDTEAGRKVTEGYRDSAGDFLGRKIPDAERKAKNADIFRMYRELPESLKKGHALAAAMHAHGRGSDVSRYYNESAEQTFERVRQLVIKMAKEERWPHPEITQALKDKDWDKVLELSEPHVYLAFEANPIGMTNGEVRDQLTSREQKHRYDALTSRANYFAPFKSITRAYLMFKNPLRLNGTGAITPQSVEQARKDGYDAIWSEGAVGGDTLGRDNRIPEVVVLSAEQVKSADPSVIPLSERFNPESDSILHAAAPERRAADAVAAGAKGREDTKEDRKAARAATMTTKPAGVASQIWDAIKGAGSATKRWWGEMPAYDSIDKAIGQWLGAGDTAPLKGTDIVIPGRQKAAHEARKLVETIVKQFPNVLTRQAISRYMEADGDKTTLQKWADQSKPETKAVYERALNLNAAEKAMAATATTFFKEKGEEAQKLGLLGNLLENYVTHFVEKAPANQRSGLMARILGDLASDTPASKLKTKFDHAIKRVFASMFDLEREGHSLRGGGDIAGTLGAYAQAANNTVADRVFVKSLTDIMARDGRPMAVPSGAITRTDGSADSPLLIKPHTHPADTSDYRPIAHPALRKWKWIGKEGEKDVLVEGELLIHPDLYKRLKNTLGTSALNNVPIIKAVGEFQGIVKQFMLSFSPFHFVQEGTHAIGHKNFKPWQVHEIDMDDPATRELVNAGLMLANWNAKAEFGEGLTANGMEKFLSHVGLGKLGKLNDTMSAFLFERYIPGLKIAMAKEAMVRNMERFKKELASGKMTREQVAQKTAQQANDAFGEQNNLYAGNNPTRLHFERLLFLAPDFLKSRAKFFADAFRKHGGEQRHALILLAVVLAVTAKLIERMLTGKNDWEKPFSVVTEGREYELRSVPGDVIALLKNRRQFVMGRISPLISRTALEAATGRDWRGVQRSAGQQVKDLAMVPIPLALRGVIDPEAPNISTAESLISSSGLRTIRHSEITKARMLGREWQKANGSDHVDEVHPPSKYVGMKNALEDGDDARAMKEYGKLLATMPKEKADTGFRSSLMKPFSGSLANEKAFVASLSGDDRATYQAAMTKRGRMLAAFTRMSATTRAPISAPKAKPSGGSSRALTAKEFFR